MPCSLLPIPLSFPPPWAAPFVHPASLSATLTPDPSFSFSLLPPVPVSQSLTLLASIASLLLPSPAIPKPYRVFPYREVPEEKRESASPPSLSLSLSLSSFRRSSPPPTVYHLTSVRLINSHLINVPNREQHSLPSRARERTREGERERGVSNPSYPVAHY